MWDVIVKQAAERMFTVPCVGFDRHFIMNTLLNIHVHA